MVMKMRLLTLGPKGTFSELACMKYLEDTNTKYEILFFSTFSDVINNMESDDIAILPFENSTDGFIQQTLDLLYHNDLTILKTLNINVSFQLVSNYEITNDYPLYVQFTAVNQTSNFINKHKLYNQIITQSNSDSLLRLENEYLGYAIIPSHIKTNFKVIYKNIEDDPHNKTRFIAITKRKDSPLDKIKKASIFVEFNEDRSGLLYELLHFFKENNINITAILSRPTRKENDSYYFFLELDIINNKIINLINTFSKNNNDFIIKVSGIY